MPDHHCHAEGCSRSVPPRMFACFPHWKMVPIRWQRALWKAYRPGQEDDKRPSRLYLLVQTRCRYEIATKEGRPTGDLVTSLRDQMAAAFPTQAATIEALNEADVLGCLDEMIA